MAEYIAKLRRHRTGEDAHPPEIVIDAVTEFEAAALALNHFVRSGEQFTGESGLELLQGNVTASKPVDVKDIVYWLRNKPEGRALVERDNLQPLLDYLPA